MEPELEILEDECDLRQEYDTSTVKEEHDSDASLDDDDEVMEMKHEEYPILASILMREKEHDAKVKADRDSKSSVCVGDLLEVKIEEDPEEDNSSADWSPHSKDTTTASQDNYKKSTIGRLAYSCELCNKTFLKLSNMKQHQLIHTGERPYSCDVCHKTFVQQSHLKEHQRTHTGERPFPCSVCEKTFPRQSELKRHLLTHTGERPHCCTFCNKSFTRLSNLKNHMRHHKE